MILCPECREPYADLDTPACLYCDWSLERRDGYALMLSARERADPIFSSYVDNYDDIAHDDLEDSIQPPEFLAAQTTRLARLVGDVRDLDVCDIGVGQGRLVRHLLAGGAASVTAVDIAAAYLDRLRSSDARLIVANAENLPFRNEFDIIVASDILEHVLNPGDMLMAAHAALRREGRFVVRVPYREDLRPYGALAGSPYRFVHLRSFTRDVLQLMLRQADFSVERIALDGFFRNRLRAPLVRRRPVKAFLDRRYPTDVDLYAMNARLGALLLRPNAITAIARKESDG
jgi:SAM-dependent methyltransferase